MTLHPRLQPPTLEAAPRRGHSFILALALTVFAAGFAYAMPRTMLTTTEGGAGGAELAPTGSTPTETAMTPTPDPTSTGADDETAGEGEVDTEGDTERAENHGAAVSTAAHCDLHGKAHGTFVRSIAHDKDATVAEVEAACSAALAAEAEEPAADGDDGGTGNHKAPKAPKARLDDDDDGNDHGNDTDDDDPGAGSADTASENEPSGAASADSASGDAATGDAASGDDASVDDDVDLGSSNQAKGPRPKP